MYKEHQGEQINKEMLVEEAKNLQASGHPPVDLKEFFYDFDYQLGSKSNFCPHFMIK